MSHERQRALLTVSGVEAFLRDHGWQPGEERQTGRLWKRIVSGEFGDSQVFVPHNRTERLERRLQDVLDAVAEDWSVPSALVGKTFDDAVRDQIRFRISAPEVDGGEIPLTYATRFFGNLERILWASARAAHSPLAVFPRSAVSTVDRFLAGLFLGQTERGSFVVQVHSPLGGDMQLSALTDRELPDDDVPFERLAAIRLVDGMRAARDIAHGPMAGLETATELDSAVDSGLSANLCFALADISPDEMPTELTVEVAWASIRKMPEASAAIHFEPGDLQRLRYVGEVLGKREPIFDFVLSGEVVELRHLRTLEGGGRIIVASPDLPGRLRTVQIDLQKESAYLAALRAHAGRMQTTFEGTLHLGGTKAVLVDAHLADVDGG